MSTITAPLAPQSDYDRAVAGRVNVSSPTNPADRLTPLDLLVGDVVETDGMTLLIESIVTWDADPDADHSRPGAPGYRPRRVAAAVGRLLAGFDGAPKFWTVQGNDLRGLSYVWR